MSIPRSHWWLDDSDVPNPTPVTERHLVSATDRLIAQVCDADRRSTLREHIHVSALVTTGGAK